MELALDPHKPLAEFDAFELNYHRLLTLSEVGSTSHGTSGHIIDDYDLMGIVIPPAKHIIGLGQWDCWVRPPIKDGYDVTLYSLHKYVSLALKSNPNVLGLLWLTPEHRIVSSPAWDRFVQSRRSFASKKAYHSFVGYAVSQLKKMEHAAYKGYMGEKRKQLVDQFGYDTKNGAHLIRLLRMGTEFLKTGELQVYRHDREELKAIKRGEWSLEKVKMTAEHLFAEAKDAYENTLLPEEPDYIVVEQLLIQTHMEYLNG